MSEFKGYPEIHVSRPSGSGPFSIQTKKGDVIATSSDEDHAARLVDCWNACRKIFAPAVHIEATDEQAIRLEKLRKEAWARVQELEAERGDGVLSNFDAFNGRLGSAPAWNYDMSSAPLGQEVTVTRKVTIDGVKHDKDYREHHIAPLWLAGADGKVYRSYWIPANNTSAGRWSGFSVGSQLPIAWMAFEVPVHPGVIAHEVAA